MDPITVVAAIEEGGPSFILFTVMVVAIIVAFFVTMAR